MVKKNEMATTNVTIPESYAVYRFEEKDGPLKLAVVPWKEPKADEIIVKVLACGVCGTYVVVHVYRLLLH